MSEITEGIVLILLAAFFQGTFALFLKFMRHWKWENFWVVFSLTALLFLPVSCCYVLVPNFVAILASSPVDALTFSFLSGIIWGIGSVLFGLSVVRIGLALTYSLIIGLTATIGSLLPLFSIGLPSLDVLFPFVLGILLMFLGLVFSAHAGMKREAYQRSKKIRIGLILAVISGLASPMLNLGFVYGSPILKTAETFGVSKHLGSIPIWVIVLFGGFIVNFGYAAYLLVRVKTFKLFSQNMRSQLLLSIASGVFFFLGLVIYGIASSLLDTLGTSMGWALLMSLMILISNFLSVLMGEWKESKKALKYQLVSISVLMLGILIMALSFYS